MSYTTLISTQELATQLGNPNWVIFDCRFTLTDPEGGRQAYEAGPHTGRALCAPGR